MKNKNSQLHIFEPNKYLFFDGVLLNNPVTPFYIIDSTKEYISLLTSKYVLNYTNLSIKDYFEYIHNRYKNDYWYNSNILNIENFNKEINNKFIDST